MSSINLCISSVSTPRTSQSSNCGAWLPFLENRRDIILQRPDYRQASMIEVYVELVLTIKWCSVIPSVHNKWSNQSPRIAYTSFYPSGECETTINACINQDCTSRCRFQRDLHEVSGTDDLANSCSSGCWINYCSTRIQGVFGDTTSMFITMPILTSTIL